MIYLEETFNLKHASPEALDAFIEFSQKNIVPVFPRIGARLVIAWYSSEEWFNQVKQILEFDDMEALKDFRLKSSQDKAYGEYLAGLEELAPVRRSRLLEPIGAVPVDVLHQTITESQETPNHIYLLAILEVGTDKMSQFKEGLAEAYKNLPIIASWRPIGGSPNEVIDIWKSIPPETAYKPADEFSKEFFRQVREVAPKERVIRVIALPYSPLC
jgi:hypothetical protein